MPHGTDDPLRALYFLPGTLAPGFVGLVFVAGGGGRRALADLTDRLFIADVKARWYVFALGYMIVVKLMVALVYRVTTSSWPAFGMLPWFLPLVIATSTVVQAGEEIGWRGIVLPHLIDRIGVRWGSVVLGAIWAAWHIPLFVIPETDLSGQPFPAFLLGVTALSVPMAWLYVRSGGSLLLVMLMHAAVNNTAQLVPSSAPGTSTVDTGIAWLTALVLWVGALVVLGLMSGRASDGVIGPTEAPA